MDSFYFIDFKQEYIYRSDKFCEDLGHTKKDAIIVLNFLRYPTPTEDEVSRSLIDVFRNEKDFRPILFINFNKEGKKVLTKQTLLQKLLIEKNLIIPVFDQYCEFLCFFGLENASATSVLKNLLIETQLNNDIVNRINQSQKEIINKILESNHRIYQNPTEAKPYWNCKILLQNLFNQDIVDEVNKVNAHITNKHIELLSGKHTSEFIQTNRIFKDIEFTMRLARGLFHKIKRKMDFDVISTFSLTGLDFARAIKREIEQTTDKEIDIICLENYRNLSLPSTFSGRLSDKKVFILLDVNNTGDLLERMVKFWQKENKNEVKGIGVAIDTRNYRGTLRNDNYYSLCSWETNVYEKDNCPLCKSNLGPIFYVDEDTLTLKLSEDKVSFSKDINEIIDKNMKEFWVKVAKSDALRWHAKITTGNYKDRHYLAFIDTERLLKYNAIASEIGNRIVEYYENKKRWFEAYKKESEFPFDIIICAPNPNSISLVQEIQQHIQHKSRSSITKIITSRKQNAFCLEEELDINLIKNSKRMLIIDDGTNTGDTLVGILYLLEKNGADRRKIEACVLIDRLTGDSFEKISRLFIKDNRFHAVYKVNIPPYVTNVHECPLCREMEILDMDRKQSNSSLIHDYCTKRIAEIGILSLPNKKSPERTSDGEKIITLKDLKLPFLYFRALLIDLVCKTPSLTSLIELLNNVTDHNLIILLIDALGMSGIPRESWIKHMDGLLDLSNKLALYEIKKAILRVVVVQGFITDEKIINFIIDFTVENAGKKEELPFLAWIAHRTRNPRLKDLLVARKKTSSTEVQRNLNKILSAISPLKIVAVSSRMRNVLARVEQAAPASSNILIIGESGTGKELIAREIHKKSNRANGPFMDVNCGAFAVELLESEFFGHEKGAFTGAINQKKGKFELADGGTIFLDEISTMSQRLQVDLLRVLQERTFQRVGGKETIKVDVRVIAATNRDIETLIKNGEFREDLYYRLNVIDIRIPPLKERIDDIRPLAYHFIEKYNIRNNKQIQDLSNEACEALESYQWPGNVRELENAIERAIVLTRSNTINRNDLPQNVLNSLERGGTFTEKGELHELNQRQTKTVNWMKDNRKSITNEECIKMNNCSRETARRDLNDLVKKEILKREGKGRGTRYRLS